MQCPNLYNHTVILVFRLADSKCVGVNPPDICRQTLGGRKRGPLTRWPRRFRGGGGNHHTLFLEGSHITYSPQPPQQVGKLLLHKRHIKRFISTEKMDYPRLGLYVEDRQFCCFHGSFVTLETSFERQKLRCDRWSATETSSRLTVLV